MNPLEYQSEIKVNHEQGPPLPLLETAKIVLAEEMARKLLSDNPQFKHTSSSYRQFGMVNCTTAIHKSRLEGAQPHDAFIYWKNIINLQHFPISHGLKPEELSAIQEGNEDLIHFWSYFSDTPDMEKMVAEIKARCQQRANKSCYIPSGWTEADSGHYMTLKARLLDNGQLAFSYLNYGAGIQYHSSAVVGTTKRKPDFRLEEYAMGEKETRDFLKRNILFTTDRTPYTAGDEENLGNIDLVNAYDELDLYAVIKAFGTPIKNNRNVHGVTAQRSGTCAALNTRATSTDALLSAEISPSRIKRFQFAMKFASIVECYKAYKTSKTEDKRLMAAYLREALSELDTRCRKHFPEIINEEELALAQAISKQIEVHLNEERDAAILAACSVQVMPPIKHEKNPRGHQLAQQEMDDKVEDANLNLQNQTSVRPAKSKDLLPPKFDGCAPGEVLRYLFSASDYFHKKFPFPKDQPLTLEHLLEVREFMRSLPLTTGKSNDPYWDRVQSEDIPEIIVLLEAILPKKETKTAHSHIECEIGVIAYDIAAHLAPRCSACKLGERFTFAFDNVYEDEFFFHEADAYDVVRKVTSNFAERSRDKIPVFGNELRNGTEDYVMKHLMTESEKRLWCLHKEGKAAPSNYTDHQIFSDMKAAWTDHYMGKGFEEPYFPTVFASLFKISKYAHGLNGTPVVYSHESGQDHLEIPNALVRKYHEHERKFPSLDLDHFFDYYENEALNPNAVNQESIRKRERTSYNPNGPRPAPSLDMIMPTGTYRNKPGESYDGQLHAERNEDFRLIEAAPHLQVQRSLEWAQYNIDALTQPRIRQRLFTFLFDYGKIEEALRESPEDLFELIEVFQKQVLDSYMESQEGLDVILWMISVSHYLQDHIQLHALNMNLDLSKVTWLNTRAVLEKLKNLENKGTIAKLYIHSFFPNGNLSNDDLLLIFKNLGLSTTFTYRATIECANVVDLSVAQVVHQHKTAIQNRLMQFSPNELNAFCDEMLEHVLQYKGQGNWHISGSMIIDRRNDFSINMHTGEILKSNKSIQRFSALIDQRLQAELGIVGQLDTATISVSEFDKDWRVIKTLDGLLELHVNETYQTQLVMRKMFVDGKEYWCEATAGLICNAPHLYFPPVTDAFAPCDLEKKPQCWRTKNKDFFLIPSDPNESSFFYSSAEKGYSIVKKDARGHFVTEGGILNLIAPRNAFETQWKEFLNTYDELKHIRVETQESKVTKINFMRLGLNFVSVLKDGQYRLESLEYRGFYLDTHQSIPELNGMKGIFILRKDKHEEHILLPAFSVKTGAKSTIFENENFIDLSKDLCTLKDDKGSKCYFHYVRRDGQLFGDTQSADADLYLSIIYSMQEDYANAMKALARTERHDNNTPLDWQIFFLIGVHHNYSHKGAAFYCQAFCRMISHEKKWVKGRKDFILPNGLADYFGKISSEQFAYYLANLSTFKTDVSSFPEYLRLSLEQERLLEEALQPSKKRLPDESKAMIEACKAETRQSIKVSLSLQDCRKEEISPRTNILTGDKEYSDKHWEQEWDNYRHIKKSEGERQPFCRVTTRFDRKDRNDLALRYLKNHFYSLYCDAISTDPYQQRRFLIDWFLLSRNEKKMSISTRAMLFMLAYVYNRPKQFQDKEFYFDGSSYTGLDISHDCFNRLLLYFQRTAKFQENLVSIEIGKPIEDNTLKPIQPLPNPHLNGEKLSFPSDRPIYTQPVEVRPLNDLADKYFHTEIEEVQTGKLPLREGDFKESLEKNIVRRFANEDGKIKKVEAHQLKQGASISGLRHELLEKQQADVAKVKELETELLALARECPTDKPSENARRILLQTARKGEQITPIEVGDIMMSLLKQDPDILTAKNCFLTQEKLEAVYQKFMELCLVQSRVSQAKEALQTIAEAGEKCDDYFQQEIGSVLSKERKYDINKYPLFLIYEYITGNILRPGQVEILQWIMKRLGSEKPLGPEEYQHLLVQFAAGGGKTAVIIPILAFWLASKGGLPVIVNTSELYNVGVKEIPESLQGTFKQHMEVLEVSLEEKWKVDKLKDLLKDMQTWHKKKRVLLIEAVSWHAINDAMKTAYAEGKIERGQAAQAVLAYLYEHGIKIEDECHIVSNPLQQAILTYGEMQSIPREIQELFMRFYDFLFGRTDTVKNEEDEKDRSEKRIQLIREVAKLSDIQNLCMKEVNPKDLQKIQEALADLIVAERSIDSVNKQVLRGYLLSPSQDKPKEIAELPVDILNLVVSNRAFIQSHLPLILTWQYGKNYAKSVHKGDLTAAPRHDGVPTTAHFADPLLKMALTIQLAGQEGADSASVAEILNGFRKQHVQEKKWMHNGTTPAEQQFQAILSDDMRTKYGANLSLDNLSYDQILQLSQEVSIRRHQWILDKYLLVYALPQIMIPLKRASSTPAEMQAGFKRGVNFSATTGLREIYAPTITAENTKFEVGFEREVLDKGLAKENGEFCIFEDDETSLDAFMKRVVHIPGISALIDRGALLCGENPKAIVAKYLELVKAKQPNQCGLLFHEQEMILLSNDPKIGEKHLGSSRIVHELKKHGLSYDELAIFVLYELSKATGSDVKMHHLAKAFVTLGKKLTISEWIQAVMRARKFLFKNAQSMVWGFYRSLFKEISADDKNFDRLRVVEWMFRNEAAGFKSKVIMSAYQNIDCIIKRHIWAIVHKSSSEYAKYKKHLEETTPFEPAQIYEVPAVEDDADKVLKAYVNDKCKDFGLVFKDLAESDRKLITIIIERTSKLIEKLSTPRRIEVGGEVFQELMVQAQAQQEAEQKQRQEVDQKMKASQWDVRGRELKSRAEKYKIEDDGLNPGFLSDECIAHQYEYYQFGTLKGLKVPPLIIHKSNLSPFIGHDYATCTKPISNLLVKVQEDGTYRLLALSSAGVEFYIQEFNRIKKGKIACDGKYAILGFDNHILYSLQPFSPKDRKDIEVAAAPMTTYAMFLNGQIKDPYLLADIVRENKWTRETYNKIAQVIAERHVSAHQVDLHRNQVFEQLCIKQCGWEKVDKNQRDLVFLGDRKIRKLRSDLPGMKLMPRPVPLPNPRYKLGRWSWCHMIASALKWLGAWLLRLFTCGRYPRRVVVG